MSTAGLTETTFPMLDPTPAPENVAIVGHGSPAAIEAACDAQALYSRVPAQLRVVIGGLVTATLLVLFVLPVLYVVVSRRFGDITGRHEDAQARG